LQESYKGVENRRDVSLAKRQWLVTFREVAHDQAKNPLAIPGITGIPVDSDPPSSVSALVEGTIGRFDLTRLRQPSAHLVEEGLDHQYTTRVRLAAHVGHQVPIVSVKLVHELGSETRADLTVSQSTRKPAHADSASE